MNCLPWQSWPESRGSATVTWRAISIPDSFVGKHGDSRGEREIGKAMHTECFRAVHFFLFILSCFLLFLSFFFKIKICPNNFIYVNSLRWWISNYYLQSGFKYNWTINEKNTWFSKIYISEMLLLYLLSAVYSFLILPSAFCHPHPSSVGIRSTFYRHPCQEG